MCRADIAHRYTDKPVYVRASEIRTRRFGAYEVHATSAPLDEDLSPTVYAARAAYEVAGIGPEDVDIAQLQDTDAGAEVIHMAETGLCADGDQEKLIADGATEIGGSTADQHRRRPDRQRRADRRIRAAADARAGPPAPRRGRRASGSG